MATTLEQHLVHLAEVPPGREGDPYLRIGDVLEIHRAHFPGRATDFAFSDTPQSADACQVVLAREIEQFAPRCTSRWASYSSIVRHFAEREDASHRTYYRYEHVFAPSKVVLHESDRPIRAYLTDEPVYPERGKLGIVRQPWLRSRALVAVAVLNSAIGLAYYHGLYAVRNGRPSRSEGGLQKPVVSSIPIAHRERPEAEINGTAELSFRVAMLTAAELDCGESFSEVLNPLRVVLLSRVARLLQLQDGVADQLMEMALPWKPRDLPGKQLSLEESLQHLPPIHRVNLLEPDAVRDLESLEAKGRRQILSIQEQARLERLRQRRHWEFVINGGARNEQGLWEPSADEPRHDEPGHAASKYDRNAGAETKLLLQINRGLPEVDWRLYHRLLAKRRSETLTELDRQALIRITDRIEQSNVQRIAALQDLAAIRGISLSRIMQDLGISTAG